MINVAPQYRPMCQPGPAEEPTPPPQQPQVAELYQAVDELLLELKPVLAQPEAVEQLGEMSSNLKTEFKEGLLAIDALPQLAEEGRQAALMAVAAGLLAGALDTAILFASTLTPPTPSPEPAPAPPQSEDLGEAIDQFLEQLKAELEQNKEAIKEMGAEALQVASAYGKSLGETYVQQGSMFAEEGHTVEELQGYLAAGFGLGYAIGITDSALINVFDKTPEPYTAG